MIQAAHIDIASLAQGGTSSAAPAKTPDQPQQTFSESLSVASKAPQQTETPSEGGTKAASRKKSSSEDRESKSTADQGAAATSSVVSPLAVQPEQVVSAQPQLSAGDAVTATDTATGMAAQPVDVLPIVAQSSKDSSQTASTPSGTGIQDLEAPGASSPDSAKSVGDVDANEAVNTAPAALSNEITNSASKASGDASSNGASSVGGDGVADPIQAPIQNTVLNAVSQASRGTDPAAVLQSVHGASTGTAVAPAARAPEQAVTQSDAIPSSTSANKIASVNGPGDGLAGAIRAGLSNFGQASTAEQSATSAGIGKTSFKNAGKDSIGDATEAKKHAEITADQSESQTGAQQAAPSGDRGQSDALSQGQNAGRVQINYASHTVAAVAHAQGTVSVSSMPVASQHASVTPTAAKSPLAAASIADALPQTQPVINTAKLINTIGQSEMRVGMRSDEFGNISISTTASKDAISAQISLDHGELAKMIAAQLPEMQARLGSSQTVNMRVDMNTGTGQGANTSGSLANGSYDQSRGGEQQSTYAASSYASNKIVDGRLSPVVATATTGFGNVNSRLDIRI